MALRKPGNVGFLIVAVFIVAAVFVLWVSFGS